ncbi:hypothetical protein [Burkholderia gladioli]|uniref:hypothetical protein n=1 Tax=Burkholderia gladioli TaxID=28095 RepID=UPI000D00C70F|nr:hypothetical protein [Burkholderia gladioli]
MYARSGARDVPGRWLGIAADVCHCRRDPRLEASIAKCGAEGRLFAFHVSARLRETRDILLDRWWTAPPQAVPQRCAWALASVC